MVKKAGTKRKKAEKAKVQLRTTSAQKTPLSKNKKKSFKLPKGRNELDTKINAKSLSLPSQLQNEDVSGPSTSKNLPIKHYLIKLKHYARATRLDGIRGIREILNNYPESAPDNLSSLMYKVPPLLSDTEDEVGKESAKLIQLIVSLVDNESLAPFHSVLSAHLCVALSHIDQAVQRTGLKALDDFIQVIPDFIQSSYKQILPSLLNQISVGKEGVKKLSNKVDCGKVTLLQWRTEVLERLCTLFRFMAEDASHNSEEASILEPVHFDDEDPFICAGIEPKYDDDSISMEYLYDDALKVVKNSHGDSFCLLNFSDNLLPLLFETWKEAFLCSGKRKQGREGLSTLVPSNSKVFLAVMEIIQLIARILKKNTESEKFDKLKKQMEKNICLHLLPGYPYYFSNVSVKNKTNEDSSISINLKFASIYINIANIPKLEVLERILDYNLSICDSRGKDLDEIYHHLLESLSFLIFQRNVTLIPILDCLIQKSLETRPRNGQLIALMSRLTSIDSCRKQSRALKEWICHLPELLVEAAQVRGSVLSVIQKLQKQNDSLLLESFSERMNFVMDKLKRQGNPTHFFETLQLLSVLSYRLQKSYPMLTDLVESAHDEYTSSFHANLSAYILVR